MNLTIILQVGQMVRVVSSFYVTSRNVFLTRTNITCKSKSVNGVLYVFGARVYESPAVILISPHILVIERSG